MPEELTTARLHDCEPPVSNSPPRIRIHRPKRWTKLRFRLKSYFHTTVLVAQCNAVKSGVINNWFSMSEPNPFLTDISAFVGPYLTRELLMLILVARVRKRFAVFGKCLLVVKLRAIASPTLGLSLIEKMQTRYRKFGSKPSCTSQVPRV